MALLARHYYYEYRIYVEQVTGGGGGGGGAAAATVAHVLCSNGVALLALPYRSVPTDCPKTVWHCVCTTEIRILLMYRLLKV